jgi:peptidoglycan/xylan/chitin deacetylase (PgdA/CDA1 family)
MRGLVACAVLIAGPAAADPASDKRFVWPEGKVAAVSLSWDDARSTQTEIGIPVLDKYGVKATFFVVPSNVEGHLKGWQQAVRTGHEIGNHTENHPCTGNLDFAADKALEDYTLDKMAGELASANKRIRDLLGVTPETFAYPCGNTFVGRGLDVRSYVPLVAAQFVVGRLWLNESANNPRTVDPSQALSREMDGKTFEELLPLIEDAKRSGKWLILAGHEMNQDGPQTTRVRTLEKLLRYLSDPKNGLWVAPVGVVGKYVRASRTAASGH